MNERAKARDETRERIVQATLQLHDEQGVVATSFVDVAKRAGIGAATVYRHFPTPGALVAACGVHVWAEMRPPAPPEAPVAFEGVEGLEARLLRLVEELDAFYQRGALRLPTVFAEREAVPELDSFLRAVDAGVEALVREATKDEGLDEQKVQLLLALVDFTVWRSMQRLKTKRPERNRLMARLLACTIPQS